MTIIDPQFGAAMLTSKGKVFTFDSGECLVKYLMATGINEKDQFFVSDYCKPGTLIDATNAAYLHGDNIRSPMGGNLAAFSNATSAKAMQKELGGELLEWNELLKKE